MIIRAPICDAHHFMLMDAIVLDGGRSSHEIAETTGLRRPVIWTTLEALANKGLVRLSLFQPGDVHPTPAGVAFVRSRLDELKERWLATPDPLPEPA